MSTGPADRIRELSRLPIWVAPMAGGPSTPGLVAAAAEAGGFGFLAGGYKKAAAVADEMTAVRAAGAQAFGVNLFVPGAPAGDTPAVAAYIAALRADAEQVGAEPGEPRWDDDDWEAKVSLLLGDPPAAVSFTFGCPPPGLIADFRRAGTLVGITVTAAGEAAAAAVAGADCLIVQGREAGAHSGVFTNTAPPEDRPGLSGLLAEVAKVAEAAGDVALVAAGGLADADAIAGALGAGAAAVALGTAFLRCPESGAHPLYKQALADPAYTETTLTRAFSGRPARALVNRFVRDHPGAPAAYPEINNATRPIRAAAAAAGDPGRMSLYAGLGFRSAADHPAGEIIEGLAAGAARAVRAGGPGPRGT
ncbi:MAG TPA: nitronate monooxygenase [Streptosporangiaceae bacterium]|jgi:nitronate monooxygenase|nr:nitronate monooxygenase [Streptosporangiaceae bacterium]